MDPDDDADSSLDPAMAERLSNLLEWFRLSGGTLHDAVEIYEDATTRLSLCVKDGCTLPADATVVSCPLSTSLSYLSAIGHPSLGLPLPLTHVNGNGVNGTDTPLVFPVNFIERTPPHVVSRFFLIYQYLLGRHSAWWPYIESLPQPDDFLAWALPSVWATKDHTQRARARMKSTNIGAVLGRMAEVLVDEFDQAKQNFDAALVRNQGQDSPASDYTFELYLWAYCIFTSRSFRPSLVLPQELHEVFRQSLPARTELDDFSILLPVLDLGNHHPEAEVAWVPRLLPANSELPPFSRALPALRQRPTWSATASAPSAPPNDCYALCFVTREPYDAGEQVYNNYGPKTNSELMLCYGFVIPPSDDLHNDYIHLRRRRDDGPNSSAGATVPTDYLLSLRPLHDPSSVVGARRQLTPTDASWFLPDAYACFEDALLWDMCLMLLTDDQQTLLKARLEESSGTAGPDADGVDARRRALLIVLRDEEEDGPFAPVATKIRKGLLGKVGEDFDDVVDTEPNDRRLREPDDGRYVELTDMAQQYRDQYRDTLLNAVKCLDPSKVSDDEEEEVSDDEEED